ncbi:MAG: cysteine desulfurase [Spirochaetaceae bacterium]|nr:cysteine desulfurase [Spirochaetaceae bacterium]
MRNIYLDWAATAVPDHKISEKIYEASTETFANASSVHSAGIKAKKLLEDSRERCANALRVNKKNIFFTSGGTESNNISIYSVIKKKAKGRVISTAIEHPSVLKPIEQLGSMGFDIVRIDSEKNGIIDPDKIEEKLTENTVLVSIIHVNNETGAIQPVGKFAEIVAKYSKKIGKKILFHCDGVQAIGKIPVDLENSNIDFYTISSHKISGPKGVGLLYCRENIDALYKGGGQESGIRPGTENIAGIYGFSLALQQAVDGVKQNLEFAKKKCSFLIENLGKIKECGIIPEHRISAMHCEGADIFDSFSPYILNFYIKKIPAEVLVRVMSEKGFFISAGSACSSHKKHESQTLKSMKIEKSAAMSSVRISIGCQTQEKELVEFCNVLEEESKKLLNIY